MEVFQGLFTAEEAAVWWIGGPTRKILPVVLFEVQAMTADLSES